MPKFTEQFFGGLLVGAALACLLTLSIAWQRLQVTADFADQNMSLFFAALKDIENLETACGSPCVGREFEYKMLMKRYGYED